ncbi:MAG: hypothetical protein AB8G05_06110 [Oligoflexales bacterium]
MDQESFEKTISQFKESVKDIGKQENPNLKQKHVKAQTPFQEPKIHDELDEIQDIPIRKKSGHEKLETDFPEEEVPARTNLLLLFGLATVLGLVLGVVFASLLVSGELDLPLKDVKQVFKTITALGSHL